MRTFKYCAIGFIATTIFTFSVFSTLNYFVCLGEFSYRIDFPGIGLISCIIGLLGVMMGWAMSGQEALSERIALARKFDDYSPDDSKVFLFSEGLCRWDTEVLFDKFYEEMRFSIHVKCIDKEETGGLPKAIAEKKVNDDYYYYLIFDGKLTEKQIVFWDGVAMGYVIGRNK